MSDLSQYCVHIGERSRKRGFPHFKLCCMCTEAVMAVGVGILYNFPILYFATGNQRMSLIYTLKVSYHVKVCDLWLFHQCA